MNYDKVKEVAERYRHDILGYARATRVIVQAERMPEVFTKYPQKNVPKLVELKHHLWMCEEILRGEMSLTKAMRWLGWLNFFVYQKGWFSLDGIKNLCRPIGEEEAEEFFEQQIIEVTRSAGQELPVEVRALPSTYDLHDPAEHGECIDLQYVKRPEGKP